MRVRLDFLTKERQSVSIRVTNGCDIANIFSLLTLSTGGRGVLFGRLVRTNHPGPLYRGLFFFSRSLFMPNSRQTTIVNSALLPKQLGIIPGLELIAWCEDSVSDGKSFSVFF
jgi:hypothetical protein